MKHHSTLWAIQRISDEKLMPLAPQGGRIFSFSKTEFSDDGPPRLFLEEGAARRALTAWCKGIWFRSDWESNPEVQPNTSRPRKDYDVIPVYLQY
jgi:hypothetical protein